MAVRPHYEHLFDLKMQVKNFLRKQIFGVESPIFPEYQGYPSVKHKKN